MNSFHHREHPLLPLDETSPSHGRVLGTRGLTNPSVSTFLTPERSRAGTLEESLPRRGRTRYRVGGGWHYPRQVPRNREMLSRYSSPAGSDSSINSMFGIALGVVLGAGIWAAAWYVWKLLIGG